MLPLAEVALFPTKKRSFRSVSFAACLASINVGKSPPHRSGPERTFQRSFFRRFPSWTAWRPCGTCLSTQSAQTVRAGRWTGARCYCCYSWELPCEMAEAVEEPARKLASKAQGRGRNSVSAVGAGVRAVRCSVTIGGVT